MWLSVSLERSGEGLACSRSRFPLSRNALAGLRLKAIRRGVWFSVLKDRERKLLGLTINVVEKVRSFLLAKLVFRIVGKLLDALEGEVARLMRSVGLPLAQKLSGIAQGWGNKSACLWVSDLGFIRYLAVNQKDLSRHLQSA